MKRWLVPSAALALAACASAPQPPAPSALFHDALFRPASEHIAARDVFAPSDEMRRYLAVDIAPLLKQYGTREGLVQSLRKQGELMLEYDSTMTRNAAQTFAARSGNCLSLVIMTAALAKELELPIRYQLVAADETVSRSGGIEFFISHVNLTLGDRVTEMGPGRRNDLMTVDFMPPELAGGWRSRPLAEETIVAMYMNNRAAETLAAGQLDEAYWWARAAIVEDARYASAYNTLGVVYRRHGNLPDAERALRYALEREPANTRAMSNLVAVLDAMGRTAEAKALAQRLAQLEPHPAFAYLDLGIVALREGNYRRARDLFAKEVERAPYYHEFHYWLAAAYIGLGEIDDARKQLSLAWQYSTTRNEREIYAAKLDRMRATHLQ
jgi:tetratricopeptide (TPR) repeat protein